MFTSNFARVKKLPPEIKPVAIAIGIPGYFKGARDQRLAPTREMLTMSRPEYIAAFDAILAALDPQQVFSELGDNVALLCWESPGVFCHRRRVAEWFEGALGIEVPEYGFVRSALPDYLKMPNKGTKAGKEIVTALEKAKVEIYNGQLF